MAKGWLFEGQALGAADNHWKRIVPIFSMHYLRFGVLIHTANVKQAIIS
jgi:hypothetical protein